MSPLALWLCVILLIGSVTAADVPFVFDDTSSGVAGYTANQFEKISTSSSDLAGIPKATTPSNDEILEFPVTGGGSTPGEKTETKVEELNRTINSKVEPDDDTVYRVAHQLAAEHPGDFTIDQVDEIYSHLKYGNDSIRAWSYSRDTRGVDKFNSASESLSLGHQAKSKCVGSGDCDDFAILIASLVESVGGTTRVIFARNNSTGGHAYAEVYLGRLNDLNGYVEEIINWLKQNYDTDKIFTHIDTDTKDVWLNLDWGPDDKGNMHPGGPFFQGDKHYIICIRNKFAKTPMNVPEKDNKPPKLISLTPNKNSPQNFGVSITWKAEANDPEKDPIQYRFFRNDEPETKWQEENIWTWTTTDYDIGENHIAVQVRDGKHASPNGFDSKKTASFTINGPEPAPVVEVVMNKPNEKPVISELAADKASPQETGSIVTWTAKASDAENDPILYRFFLNGLRTTDWQSHSQWSWTAAEGEAQVEVQVRDGEHAGQDRFDDSKSEVFTIAPQNQKSSTVLEDTSEMTEYQKGVANGLKIGLWMGENHGRGQYETDYAGLFNTDLESYNQFLRTSFANNQTLINEFMLSSIASNTPSEPIITTSLVEMEMTEYQKGVANGLKIGLWMGENHGRGQYETDYAGLFNTDLESYNQFLRTSFANNQTLINEFMLSSIAVT